MEIDKNAFISYQVMCSQEPASVFVEDLRRKKWT